ncbi:hypothetical protein P3S68_032564 [Capsicum galapagoense]
MCIMPTWILHYVVPRMFHVGTKVVTKSRRNYVYCAYVCLRGPFSVLCHVGTKVIINMILISPEGCKVLAFAKQKAKHSIIGHEGEVLMTLHVQKLVWRRRILKMVVVKESEDIAGALSHVYLTIFLMMLELFWFRMLKFLKQNCLKKSL